MKTVRLTEEQIEIIKNWTGGWNSEPVPAGCASLVQAEAIGQALADATDTPGLHLTAHELDILHHALTTRDSTLESEQEVEEVHNLLAKLEAHGPGGSTSDTPTPETDLSIVIEGGMLADVYVSDELSNALGRTPTVALMDVDALQCWTGDELVSERFPTTWTPDVCRDPMAPLNELVKSEVKSRSGGCSQQRGARHEEDRSTIRLSLHHRKCGTDSARRRCRRACSTPAAERVLHLVRGQDQRAGRRDRHTCTPTPSRPPRVPGPAPAGEPSSLTCSRRANTLLSAGRSAGVDILGGLVGQLLWPWRDCSLSRGQVPV